jgi:hypothetical protein
MCFTILGEFSVLTKNDTVHLTMASGLPHKLLTDVVVLVLGLISLFEECAFDQWVVFDQWVAFVNNFVLARRLCACLLVQIAV